MSQEWDQYIDTPASESVIALQDAKSFLGVTHDEDDDLIQSLISGAAAQAEAIMNRTLLQTTRVLLLSHFRDEILLPQPPCISVDQIQYLDTDGVQQTLASSVYQVNTTAQPARIKLAYNQDWPDYRNGQYNSVTITYKSGYGKNRAHIPADIMTALKMIVSTNYDIREDVIVGTIATKIPNGAESILMRHRMMRFDVA